MRIYYPTTGPVGAPELRMDQLVAIAQIEREITDPTRSGSVLVGAGMGSGKTVVSVEVIIKTAPARCLIVGVRDAYSQWKKTMIDQGAGRILHRIDGTIPGRDNLKRLLDGDDGVFYVGLEYLRAQDWASVSETWKINPADAAVFGPSAKVATSGTHMVRKQLHTFAKMVPVDLLISDESHRHSNQKSNSIKTVRDISAVAKIALSGTFFGNKFENAWSLTTWLWGKKVIGTKGTFEATYCVKVPVMSKDGRKQMKSPGGFPLTKIMGERNPGDFVETLPCYVFIATPIGPVPKPEIVKVPLGREQRRQYNEMLDQSLTWVKTTKGITAPLVADLALTQRQRLRTAALGAMTLVPGVDEDSPDSITFSPGCASTTLNIAYDVLHRPSWVGKKVLILTHSKPFAEEAARRIGMKYPVALKTGDVSGNQWDIDKASFMSDDAGSIQYLVAVVSAVGTATDGLQANCSRVLWLSEDDNNVNNVQGSNRIWRQGVSISDYEAVKIVQEGTIAEGVLGKNDSHRESLLESVSL